MNIRTIEEGEWCHYCHQEFNGIEEGFIQPIESGESAYHLRCIGKLIVYRIEGVLPKHLFRAVVDELAEPLPESLFIKIEEEQTVLDDFNGEEE